MRRGRKIAKVPIAGETGGATVLDVAPRMEYGITTKCQSSVALFSERICSVLGKILDIADIVIALGKAWKRRNRR